MAVALRSHDEILRAAVEATGGAVIKTTGDGLLAAFDEPGAAVRAALDGQRRLRDHAWAATGPLLVRMAIHTGAAETRDGDFHGTALNRVARLLAIGHGGQVLLSSATVVLLMDDLPPGATLLDRGEHRLRDLSRPEQVTQLVAPDLPREFPALRSERPPSNLPAQLTSFIGRGRELAEVDRQLRDHRLVTLIGVGGTGKTRLVLRVADDVVGTLPERRLAGRARGATDPDLVAAGDRRHACPERRESAGAAGRDARSACARARRSLVLDNCEHLLDAGAALADDAAAPPAPALRVLATSREALGAVAASWSSRCASLALPDPASRRAHAGRRGGAAARAGRVGGRASPSPTQRGGRGPGLPPPRRHPTGDRARRGADAALTAEQIAERLDERFRLLTGGRARACEAPADAAGHDRLVLRPRSTTPNAPALRRLAVFAGGFDLDAAEPRPPPATASTVRRADPLGRPRRQVARRGRPTATAATTCTAARDDPPVRRASGSTRPARSPPARGRHAAHYVDALERAIARRGVTRSCGLRPGPPRGAGRPRDRSCATGDADGALRLATPFLNLNMIPGITVAGAAARFTVAVELPRGHARPRRPRCTGPRGRGSPGRRSGGDPSPPTRLRNAPSRAGRRDRGRADSRPARVRRHRSDARRLRRRGHEAALRGLLAAERIGDHRAATLCSVVVSMGERYRGDLAAAVDAARHGEAAGRRVGADDMVAANLLLQGFALAGWNPNGHWPSSTKGPASSARCPRRVVPPVLRPERRADPAAAGRPRDGATLHAGLGRKAFDICERTVGHEYVARRRPRATWPSASSTSRDADDVRAER